MKSIISALVTSLLLLAGQAFAAPDAVVFEGGDVRINGLGNGLVFPDGTIQTTANGISKGVHGTIAGSSVPVSGAVQGTGFAVARTTGQPVGSYDITFTPAALSSTPDCVISPVGHGAGAVPGSFIGCEVTTVSGSSARVVCISYNGLQGTTTLINTTFTFICVN